MKTLLGRRCSHGLAVISLHYICKTKRIERFEHLTGSVGTGVGLQPGTRGACLSLGAGEGSLSKAHDGLV